MPRTGRTADMLVCRASVDSTNALARRLIQSGSLPMPEPVDPTGHKGVAPGAHLAMHVIAADMQTAGHGRLGRHWVDRPGRSFIVSFVTSLPSDLVRDPRTNGWLSVIAGLSCMDAIRGMIRDNKLGGSEMTDSFKVKWPNDIMCDGHKLGGILIELVAETADNDEGQVGVIFGIGMNLTIPADGLPTDQSTSLQLRLGPIEPENVRDELASRIVVALRNRLGSLLEGRADAIVSLMHEMTAECWTLGRQVVARLAGGGVIRGTAMQLCDDASLRIRDENGAMHIVHTADVGVLG